MTTTSSKNSKRNLDNILTPKGSRPYQCQYCGNRYAREATLERHSCEEMRRVKTFESIEGQLAFELFKNWYRLKRRIVDSRETFLNSRHFNSIVKFAGFVRNSKLPYVDKFIEMCVDKDYDPHMWLDPVVYGQFCAFIDRNVSPMKLLEQSLTTLSTISEKNDVDLEDVFNVISPMEVIDLIQRRKLSPWFLFNSQKFREFDKTKMTGESRIIFDSMIDTDRWIKTLTKDNIMRQRVKKVIKELGL